MVMIKTIPEDFIVEEIASFKYSITKEPEKSSQQNYKYYKLTKRNLNTLDAIEKISKKLHIKPRNIGFAGLKDKKAITTQYISINASSKKIKSLTIPNIKLEFVGYGSEPITVGSLLGNSFIIVVRDLTERDIKKLKQKTDAAIKIPNYYGGQRFGTKNAEIGRLIIKKKFKEATSIVDSEDVKNYLEHNPCDYIGALKRLNPRLIALFTNSFQSYLWNKVVERLISENKVFERVPLVGFDGIDHPIIEKYYKELLDKENISYRDFIIKPFPYASCESGERKMFVEPKDLSISGPVDDDFFQGRKKITLSFKLPKSAYATVVVENLFL